MSAVSEPVQPASQDGAATMRSGVIGPLIEGAATRVVAFDAEGMIDRQRFEDEVRGLAATLPAARHAINLCADRYRFLVAFFAAASRGQTTLLPPSRAPAVIDQVRADYPDSYCLGDEPLTHEPPCYRRPPAVLPQLARG